MNVKKYSALLPLMLLGVTSLKAQFLSNPKPEDSVAPAHIPGSGFRIVSTKFGTLNFATYVTFRYLNQGGMDTSYTDAFGRQQRIARRNDLQMQKVMLYFMGWLFDPNFRYTLYVWTSNANIGQTTQVVVAGNLQYKIKKYLEIGGGVAGIPTSRSMIGNWPNWLRQDARPMAEEFFRGGFTTGIWAQGEIANGLFYKTAIGNNLSQLGIDAGQLDAGFDTWGTSLWWTTNDFGRLATYGDFENHEQPATILGAAYTRSNETWQSQPGQNAPENSQIRLSDGTGLFSLNAFGNGTQILAAKYELASVNGGIKFKGFSLDAEYYLRWLSKFKTLGQIPVSSIFDNGFSVQASGMVINKTLQLYGAGSYIDGEYGKPWEYNVGLNWFILKNRVLRLNSEVIFTHHSPVGYLAYPTTVGSTGTIFMVNLELFF